MLYRKCEGWGKVRKWGLGECDVQRTGSLLVALLKRIQMFCTRGHGDDGHVADANSNETVEGGIVCVCVCVCGGRVE